MSAAEPIRLPTRMRYIATSSLPANPTIAAAITQGRCVISRGSIRRLTACHAANAADAAITSTIMMPARSSARS